MALRAGAAAHPERGRGRPPLKRHCLMYNLLGYLQCKPKPFDMATILPVEGKYPRFGNNCFVAPNATVVGDVEIGDQCSIWFNAVVRGDVNSIHIGHKVNI